MFHLLSQVFYNLKKFLMMDISELEMQLILIQIKISGRYAKG